MRIISKDKDYYDCIQSHGQDRSLIYIRNPEKVLFKNKGKGGWPFPLFHRGWWQFSFDIVEHVIGFCGKIYPMLKISRRWSAQPELRDVTKCFSIEEIDVFMERNLTPKEFQVYLGKVDQRTLKWTRTNMPLRKVFLQFFVECDIEKNRYYSEYFTERRCPVFVATQGRSTKIVYNATLKPYDFVRIFDPYTAFQEISMFLGSMAMPEKEMPIIPNEIKLRSKGFTDQSFRAPFRDSRRIAK